MGEPLEPLPRIQPHQLILGQMEAQGGLVRCGQKPGLRPSQSGWGRAAAATSFQPEEEESFLGEPLVPAGSGLSVPWDTKEGATLALLHHLPGCKPTPPHFLSGKRLGRRGREGLFGPSAHGRPDQGSGLSPVGVS